MLYFSTSPTFMFIYVHETGCSLGRVALCIAIFYRIQQFQQVVCAIVPLTGGDYACTATTQGHAPVRTYTRLSTQQSCKMRKCTLHVSTHDHIHIVTTIVNTYLTAIQGLFHFHEELLEHRSDSPGPYASPSTTQSFKRVPDKGTAVKGCKTESDVFAALGLPFIEPCHREFWDYSTGYNSSTESTKHKPYRETFHEHFPQEFEELLQTPDALAANNWLTSDEEKDQNSHGKRSNGDKKIANKKAKSVLETVPSIRIKHT